jgi:hypothetical protein
MRITTLLSSSLAFVLLCIDPMHAQLRAPAYCATMPSPRIPPAHVNAFTTSRGGTGAITIPTVVHVIHQGGVENISDAQVLSQLDVLNADFRRLNADTVNTREIFQPVAADMELEFCLASIDPQDLPTTGIDRVFTAVTNSTELIAQYGWDNTRYMNIYVMPSGSCFSSMPWDPASEDGIFVTHGRFGTIGTAGTELYAEFSRFGRTGTHEVGHYIGLYHTFSFIGDTSLCFGGDSICDTPPADMRWVVSACLDHTMNTNNEVPDQPDQVENYMDYNTDSCMNMFTIGQRERAVMCLELYRPVLWSEENLVSTGCASSTGIDERPAQDLTLAPNPASSYLEFNVGYGAKNRIAEVYTLHGDRVPIPLSPPGMQRIDVGRLANGVYVLKVTSGDRSRTARFVVMR